MRLMAVLAHPDDAEIWCGGTLILHADRGDEVHICTLSYTKDSERGQEAREGAIQMGCKLEMLGMQDAGIRDTGKAASDLWHSIESFLPDTIITHWVDDMHPDHQATFLLVRRALLLGYLENLKDSLQAFPRIFCCDNMGSIGLHGPFKPDRYVDVNPFWQKKIDAINAHRSQPLWYYRDMIDKQCAEHGQASGKRRAEAFLYVPFFGFADTGPSLGE